MDAPTRRLDSLRFRSRQLHASERITTAPSVGSEYDFVICTDILEYLENAPEVLRKLDPTLKARCPLPALLLLLPNDSRHPMHFDDQAISAAVDRVVVHDLVHVATSNYHHFSQKSGDHMGIVNSDVREVLETEAAAIIGSRATGWTETLVEVTDGEVSNRIWKGYLDGRVVFVKQLTTISSCCNEMISLKLAQRANVPVPEIVLVSTSQRLVVTASIDGMRLRASIKTGTHEV